MTGEADKLLKSPRAPRMDKAKPPGKEKEAKKAAPEKEAQKEKGVKKEKEKERDPTRKASKGEKAKAPPSIEVKGAVAFEKLEAAAKAGSHILMKGLFAGHAGQPEKEKEKEKEKEREAPKKGAKGYFKEVVPKSESKKPKAKDKDKDKDKDKPAAKETRAKEKSSVGSHVLKGSITSLVETDSTGKEDQHSDEDEESSAVEEDPRPGGKEGRIDQHGSRSAGGSQDKVEALDVSDPSQQQQQTSEEAEDSDTEPEEDEGLRSPLQDLLELGSEEAEDAVEKTKDGGYKPRWGVDSDGPYDGDDGSDAEEQRPKSRDSFKLNWQGDRDDGSDAEEQRRKSRDSFKLGWKSVSEEAIDADAKHVREVVDFKLSSQDDDEDASDEEDELPNHAESLDLNWHDNIEGARDLGRGSKMVSARNEEGRRSSAADDGHMEAMRKEIIEKEQALEESKGEVKSLKGHLLVVSSQKDQEIAELAEALSRKDADIRELKLQLGTMKANQEAEMKGITDELETEVEELKVALEALQAKYRDEVDGLTKQIAESSKRYESQAEDLRREVKVAKSKAEVLQKEVEDEKARHVLETEELQKQMARTMAHVMGQEEEEGKLEEILAEKHRLEVQNSEFQSEIEKLKKERDSQASVGAGGGGSLWSWGGLSGGAEQGDLQQQVEKLKKEKAALMDQIKRDAVAAAMEYSIVVGEKKALEMQLAGRRF